MRGFEALDDAIRRKVLALPIDAAIAVVAECQKGSVTRAQLVELGLHPRAIDRRVTAGRLHRLHRGVYSVGDRALPSFGRLMAAVLATAAPAGRRSAAALHGLRAYDGWPEVIVRPGTKKREGIRAIQATLEPDEITRVQGIPVTTVARTLIDLGTVADAVAVDRAVREAEFLGLFDLSEVSRLLDRYARRPGTARLRRVIRAFGDSGARTRSDMEDRFRALVLDASLPEPEMNATIELDELTIEADAVWREAKLIAELDGWQAHGTRYGFETDRERDRLLALTDWLVVRITWRQLSEQPRRLIRDIRTLLERRRT
jgi:very-short-patch-repair endonuclease/predicted transcriptional regulator of viral defense system